ncbi:MAG: N-acetylglucosamine-6-phosphate deacetylase [Erysipelothrix sp.]|nr:N-acetylglucosamine-6-phosphate deacetylase [Erysipelothrix sp.]
MRIRSSRVYINEELQAGVIEIENNKIIAIDDYDTNFDIDYQDDMILPGFIEIHSHGYGGQNASRPSLEGLQMWANSLPSEGVTSFLATTGTQSYDANINALEIISSYMENNYQSGANLVGINVEGNFIDHTYRGAQDENNIVTPDPKIFNDYLKASKHKIKTVLCAVELDKDYAFVDNAVKKGVAVSVGHSGATYDQVKGALKFGLSGATHTGNGMRPFHHREPGVFGAAMNMDQLYAEVIVDGLHLHFETVNIIGRLKGKDKLVLVTDSSSYKDYDGQEEGYVRYIGEDGSIRNAAGNLSGSNLRFNDGVYNAINHAHLDFTTVINAATINPAKYIKMDDTKGLIKVGYDADLVIVDDKFKVKEAIINGIKQ